MQKNIFFETAEKTFFYDIFHVIFDNDQSLKHCDEITFFP